MKIDRHGQAKILTSVELQKLFSIGFLTSRDRALFAICFFTACRISEALQLEKSSISDSTIILKKHTTKGKSATREIKISQDLRSFLKEYNSPKPLNPYYFPGLKDHLKINQAHKILVAACKRVGIVGASTHSFRRTALTMMHKKGASLRTIQEISGHKSLLILKRYLEVSEEEKESAIKLIGWG